MSSSIEAGLEHDLGPRPVLELAGLRHVHAARGAVGARPWRSFEHGPADSPDSILDHDDVSGG